MEELAKAIAAQNLDRVVEVEEANIATVNDQILEHEAAMAQNRIDIESLRQAIRTRREDTARRKAEQRILRQRRKIFTRAAFALREVSQP